jgi:micrococcal nuclease
MSNKSARMAKRVNNLSKKLIVVPAALLIGLLSVVSGTKYEKEIRQMLNQPTVNQTQNRVLPKEGVVKRVIDGDTIELEDGTSIRLVGVNTPEPKDSYYQEAKKFTEKLVGGKKVTFQYDAYTSDRFGRVLAYVFIGDKNLSVELVKNGLAKVAIYEDRRKLIYQDQLLQAELTAQGKKQGIWGNQTIN